MPNDTVQVTVRFMTIMQRYSGKREMSMKLPHNPSRALDIIFDRFHIPWKGNLEGSTRIFINGESDKSFIKSGKLLKAEDTIAFIPISSGG